MKTTFLFLSMLAMTSPGQAASGGGSAGGGAAGGGASTGASPMSPVSPARAVSGSSRTTTTTPNRPAESTPSAMGANNSLFPMGAASGNNGFHNDFRLRDHAVTTSDQTLLTTLDQMIHTQLGIPLADGLPVHLIIDNGAVTLVGFVTTADEQQRILSQVEQLPGVMQVVNRLHVGMPSTEVDPRTVQGNADPTQVNPLTPAFNEGQVDRAFSAPDQRLLQEIRQTAAVQLGMNPNVPRNTLVAPQLPVHFVVQDGVVTVTGQVVTTTQETALVAAIGQTPGVVRVVNNLQVGGVNAVSQSGMTTN